MSQSPSRTLWCSTCKRGFKYKSQLERHSLSHNDSRPFICSVPVNGSDTDVCGTAFKYDWGLKRHIKVIHFGFKPTTTAFDSAQKGWRCQHCGVNRVVPLSGKGGHSTPTVRGDQYPRSAMKGVTKISVCNRCGLHWNNHGDLPSLEHPTRKSVVKCELPKHLQKRKEMLEKFANSESKQFLLGCRCSKQCVANICFQESKVDAICMKEQEIEELEAIHKHAILLKTRAPVSSTPLAESSRKKVKKSPGGQHHPIEFEEHVLASRKDLKGKGLCEYAVVTILACSLGYLYGKNVEGVPRINQGKKYRVSIDDLHSYICCNKQCLVTLPIEWMAYQRASYETANQSEKCIVIQRILCGNGVGSAHCNKSISILLGCSTSQVSIANSLFRHHKRPGVIFQHRLTGRSPTNKTPKSIEDSFWEFVQMNTATRPENPSVLAFERQSMNSNRALKKEFAKQLGYEMPFSTVRNIQKRTLTDHGVKHIRRLLADHCLCPKCEQFKNAKETFRGELRNALKSLPREARREVQKQLSSQHPKIGQMENGSFNLKF